MFLTHQFPTLFYCVIAFLFSSPHVWADITLPHPISSNMVLQQGMDVPIWGWAEPGETVRVTIGQKDVTTTTGEDGRWKATLGPMEAGGPYTLALEGKTRIELENVLVGEVWICSGQSNMERSVAVEWDGDREVAETDFPKIRLFKVAPAMAGTPQEDTQGSWETAVPETVGEFSAAGFYFGRELLRELDVPIGLVQSTWDGSSMYGWSPHSAIEEVWQPKYLLQAGEDLAESTKAMREYLAAFSDWVDAAEKAEAEGKVIPPEPEKPRDHRQSQDSPARLFNGMIAPLIPYAIRGVIWHQGESDASRAARFKEMFPAMVRGWRAEWGQGDFPFLFVQLNGFLAGGASEPGESKWAEFRDEQRQALSEPNTAMVVTIDIGDPHNIHPRNKREVARRLSLAALATVYGKDIPYSGPLYSTMETEGNGIRVHFEHTTGGLGIKGGKTLNGFTIAGQDRQFKPAAAKIEGDSILVFSPEVPYPAAVRYGWGDNPECNLFNKVGLPASPFRTDDWPGAVREMR